MTTQTPGAATSTPVALGIRLLAHLRAGHVLAARPRGVAHLYAGRLTRAGHPAGRPLCGRHLRRLTVLDGPHAVGKQLRGYRVCRGCTRLLPPTPGWVRPLVSRDDFIEAFGHLVLIDFKLAALWARTVAETHQVGYLASYVIGPAGAHPVSPAEWKRLDQLIVARRRVLEVRERTPEEVEALRAQRQIEQAERDAIRVRDLRERRITKALDRKHANHYLTPAERELVAGI